MDSVPQMSVSLVVAVRKKEGEELHYKSVGTVFPLILSAGSWFRSSQLKQTGPGGEIALYLHIPQFFHSI